MKFDFFYFYTGMKMRVTQQITPKTRCMIWCLYRRVWLCRFMSYEMPLASYTLDMQQKPNHAIWTLEMNGEWVSERMSDWGCVCLCVLFFRELAVWQLVDVFFEIQYQTIKFYTVKHIQRQTKMDDNFNAVCKQCTNTHTIESNAISAMKW